MAKKRKKHAPLERTAYHEAGHAVIAMQYAREFDPVSIEPDDEAGSAGRMSGGWPEGFDADRQRSLDGLKDIRHKVLFENVPELQVLRGFLRELDDVGELVHAAKAHREIIIRLAGFAAVKHLTGRKPPHVDGDDLTVAHTMAGALEGKEVANALLEYLTTKVEMLVSTECTWRQIVALARELLRARTLTADEARAVVELVGGVPGDGARRPRQRRSSR